jgi:hypothetical protein
MGQQYLEAAGRSKCTEAQWPRRPERRVELRLAPGRSASRRRKNSSAVPDERSALPAPAGRSFKVAVEGRRYSPSMGADADMASSGAVAGRRGSKSTIEPGGRVAPMPTFITIELFGLARMTLTVSWITPFTTPFTTAPTPLPPLPPLSRAILTLLIPRLMGAGPVGWLVT